MDDLIEARVPRAAANDPGWMYQQRATADFDGDGAREDAVLISDVTLDANGLPLWEDGHRWQVYVEEPGGMRTYLYARFLPNGHLTADLTTEDSLTTPTILLMERTRDMVGIYQFRYDVDGTAVLMQRVNRTLDPTATFSGAPRP